MFSGVRVATWRHDIPYALKRTPQNDPMATRMIPTRPFTFTIDPTLLAPTLSTLYDGTAEQTEPSELIKLDCTVTRTLFSTFSVAELYADTALSHPAHDGRHFLAHLLPLLACTAAPPSLSHRIFPRRALSWCVSLPCCGYADTTLSACRVCHLPELLALLSRTTSLPSYSLTRNYGTCSFSLPLRFPLLSSARR